MSIDHEALASRSSEVEVYRIRTGELEPYRADIEAWIEAGRPGGPYRRQELESIITNPSGMVDTIPALFSWMRENHRGPWAPKDEVVTVAGGFHVGDIVRYNGRAGSIVGQERMVAAPLSYAPHGVAFDGGRWAFPDTLELVSCPHQIDPDPAGLPDGRPAPEGYIPWGPDHPDWHPFWDKAEAFAKNNRYCDEYTRIVAEVDGRPLSTTERVTLEVTISLTTTVASGTEPDPAQLLTIPAGSSLTVQNSREQSRRPIYRRI